MNNETKERREFERFIFENWKDAEGEPIRIKYHATEGYGAFQDIFRGYQAARASLPVKPDPRDAVIEKLKEGLLNARLNLSFGLGMVNHKFKSAGGVFYVATNGVELGSMSWASNVENGLRDIEIALEKIDDTLAAAEALTTKEQ